MDNQEGTTIAPPEIIVEERDKHLLNMMNAWLYDHISDPTLSVDQVAIIVTSGQHKASPLFTFYLKTFFRPKRMER